MRACTLARFVLLPGTAVLLWGCLAGSWSFVAEAVVLPRRAAAQGMAAQGTATLSPAEKQRLFQRFQEMQGAAGQAAATPPAPPEPALAPRNAPAAIQPAPASGPARTRPSSGPAPTPLAFSATVRRVVIHVSAGSAAETLSARLLADLDPQFDKVELRRVAATPSRPSIRYFYPEDAAIAQDVAAQLSGTRLAWIVRDFSAFRPLPSRGTIEVWLPERA